MSLESLLAAITADPADDLAWSAVADCLEERGQPDRAELTRITHALRRTVDVPGRAEREARAQGLLAAGVLPCVAEVTNSIGMRLVLIPPGEFLMGSPQDEEDREEDEGPRHRVRITRAFWLGTFPVSQAEYEKVVGKNPSYFSAKGIGNRKVRGLDTARFPVEMVSYEDAVRFCKRLSALAEERRGKCRYRLPSEAEWEYACRAGTTTPFHHGTALSSRQANFDGTYPYGGAEKGPFLRCNCEVGAYRPNAFGLFDMHGNVWEWCSDWYAEHYYSQSPESDPPGPAEGTARLFRGGSWSSGGQNCRSAYRGRNGSSCRSNGLGFRVALVPRE